MAALPMVLMGTIHLGVLLVPGMYNLLFHFVNICISLGTSII